MGRDGPNDDRNTCFSLCTALIRFIVAPSPTHRTLYMGLSNDFMASRAPEDSCRLDLPSRRTRCLGSDALKLSAISYEDLRSLEGEQEQESHHKTEETHGLGQSKAQDGI